MIFSLFRKPTTKEIRQALLRKIRYPKFILLILSVFIGYLIYQDGNNFNFHEFFQSLGYFGTFIAGFFFVYGFTTAPSVAVLLIISPTQNFWLAGLVAMLGGIAGNVIVFRSMRVSVAGELSNLSGNKLLKVVIKKLDKHMPDFVRSYILPALAGFIAATPIPDELAVALLSRSRDISLGTFTAFAMIFNVFGIFIILLVGRLLAAG